MDNIPKSEFQAGRQPQVSLSTDFKVPGAMLQSRARAPLPRGKGSMRFSWHKLVEGGAQPFTSIYHGTNLFKNLTAEFLVSNLESWQWHSSWHTWNISLAHINTNSRLHGSTHHLFFNKAAAFWSLNVQVQGKGVILNILLEAKSHVYKHRLMWALWLNKSF